MQLRLLERYSRVHPSERPKLRMEVPHAFPLGLVRLNSDRSDQTTRDGGCSPQSTHRHGRSGPRSTRESLLIRTSGDGESAVVLRVEDGDEDEDSNLENDDGSVGYRSERLKRSHGKHCIVICQMGRSEWKEGTRTEGEERKDSS